MNTITHEYPASQVSICAQRRWLWSLWFLLSLCATAFGAVPTVNVLIDLKDARLNAGPSYTNRTVWVQMMSVPNVSSPSVILGNPIIGTTDSNGQWWVSNLVANLFALSVKSPH